MEVFFEEIWREPRHHLRQHVREGEGRRDGWKRRGGGGRDWWRAREGGGRDKGEGGRERGEGREIDIERGVEEQWGKEGKERREGW